MLCCSYAENPLHTFPRNFSVDGEVANFYGLDLVATRPTSPQQVVVMEFGKRHDTTDTRTVAHTNLLRTCRSCRGRATGKLVQLIWALTVHYVNCCCSRELCYRVSMSLRWAYILDVCPLSVTERFLLQPLVCGTIFHRTSLLPPSLSIFCCRLKSHLFSLSYPAFRLFSHLHSARSVARRFGHYYNRYYI